MYLGGVWVGSGSGGPGRWTLHRNRGKVVQGTFRPDAIRKLWRGGPGRRIKTWGTYLFFFFLVGYLGTPLSGAAAVLYSTRPIHAPRRYEPWYEV